MCRRVAQSPLDEIIRESSLICHFPSARILPAGHNWFNLAGQWTGQARRRGTRHGSGGQDRDGNGTKWEWKDAGTKDWKKDTAVGLDRKRMRVVTGWGSKRSETGREEMK